jgi:hypothetical protein
MPLTQRHVILELTAQAATPLVAYHSAYGHLRGCQIRAERLKGRANGRVYVTVLPPPELPTALPTEPDLVKALSIIWNLPATDLTTPDRLRGQTHVANDPPNGKPRHKTATPS